MHDARTAAHLHELSNGFRMEFVGRAAQADREVVLVADSHDCDALAFASPTLRDDREIIQASLDAANRRQQGQKGQEG